MFSLNGGIIIATDYDYLLLAPSSFCPPLENKIAIFFSTYIREKKNEMNRNCLIYFHELFSFLIFGWQFILVCCCCLFYINNTTVSSASSSSYFDFHQYSVILIFFMKHTNTHTAKKM